MGWPSKTEYFSLKSDPLLRDPDGTLMDDLLMVTIDHARAELGAPFIVTSGYRTNTFQDKLVQQGITTAKKSSHTEGKGKDGCFKDTPLLAGFIHLTRYKDFEGLGLYPFTNPPVLHADTMDRGKETTTMWIRNSEGVYVFSNSPRWEDELEILAIMTAEGKV